jgi:ribosomal protein S24E
MDIKITGKKDNNAIGREECIAEVSFTDKTPSRQEIKNAIVSKIGKSPELIVIRKIEQHAGAKNLKVIFHVYSDAEVLKRVEPIYIQKREGLLKEDKKE